MADQFENNYSTQLNGSINNSVTTITVDAVPTGMTGNFRIKIENELIFVGAVSGSTFTNCIRGSEGTTAASHADNTPVYHVLTAEVMEQLSLLANNPTTTAGDMLYKPSTPTNLTTGASVSVSQSFGGSGPNLVDGNFTTYWDTNNGQTDAYATYDLSTAQTVGQVRLLNGRANSATGGWVTDLEVQYSSDNVNFFEYTSILNPSSQDTGIISVGYSISARYWRIVVRAFVAGNGSLIDFGLYPPDGGLTRLGIGTINQIITSNGSIPYWNAVPEDGQTKPDTAGTYNEEFEGTADNLPTNWSWISTPSTWKLNSQWRSWLIVEHPSSTSETKELRRASVTPGANDFGIWWCWSMGLGQWNNNTSWMQLDLLNSGETEGRGIRYGQTSSMKLDSRSLISSVEADVTNGPQLDFGARVYCGMTRKTSDNTWRYYFSMDGITWTQLGGSVAHSFTIDRIRIRFNSGNNVGIERHAIDFVRSRADLLLWAPR